MANPTPLNVPTPVVTGPNPTPMTGAPATTQVIPPAVAAADLLRVQGLSGHAPQAPSTPEGDPAGQTLGGALSSDVQNSAAVAATTVAQPGVPANAALQVPVAPPVSAGMTPGVSGAVSVPVNGPATPGIISSTSPVPVGQPTLATAGPLQGSAAPRIAGVQMVPPTPPAVQTASQLTQPTNAPQALQGIATLLQS